MLLKLSTGAERRQAHSTGEPLGSAGVSPVSNPSTPPREGPSKEAPAPRSQPGPVWLAPSPARLPLCCSHTHRLLWVSRPLRGPSSSSRRLLSEGGDSHPWDGLYDLPPVCGRVWFACTYPLGQHRPHWAKIKASTGLCSWKVKGRIGFLLFFPLLQGPTPLGLWPLPPALRSAAENI